MFVYDKFLKKINSAIAFLNITYYNKEKAKAKHIGGL